MSTPDVFFIPSSLDGRQLHTMVWGIESPRAVLQISHGMAEHIARYDKFARFLNKNGIAVIGASHLGHGLTAESEKELGFIAPKNGWEHMVSDLHIVREFAAQKFPGVPHILFGHSMGSFLARTYITRDISAGLAGVIISGTANQPAAIASVGKTVGRILTLFQGARHRSKFVNSLSFGSYNKNFSPARTEFDWLSTNESNIDSYVNDPLCGFCFTLSAFCDLFDGLKYIADKKHISKINKKLPCLFSAGACDPVGEDGKGVEAVAELYRKSGIVSVDVKLYDGFRHEILNEPEREIVFKDLISFINRILSK